ncbi:MAG: hypothetical protein H6815_05445 [Phycisphaeraceae bacterium]|nr:hypothetical protein [Phycisphaerales bacterium]MCB9859882.1 hypothetical protein [Phycisphaeraceae bacterium]
MRLMHVLSVGAVVVSSGYVSAQTLVCGPAGTGITRGALIDVRNDSPNPIQLDSLDFFIGAGSAAPPVYTTQIQCFVAPGGWEVNASMPANWTVIGDHTYDLTGAHGSTEHMDLDVTTLVINPGETYGFALLSHAPNTSSVRSLTVQTDATGPYSDGKLTAVPGAIANDLNFTPNQFGIGTRMYSGSINYTELDSCYADCDGSGSLNIFDYICFGNEYSAQTSYGDCDGNSMWNIFDYICFGNEYSAGCP